jgi:hypothetical protein
MMDCKLLISEVLSKKPPWKLSLSEHYIRGALDKPWDVVANKMKSCE